MKYMTSKKITSLAMATILLVSVTQTSLSSFSISPKIIKKPAILIGSLILGVGIYKLFLKNPVKNPVSRFDSQALSQALKEKNFKTVMQQLGYFFDDEFVGQCYKSSSIKIDEDGKSLFVHPGARPTGVLGKGHAYLYPLGKVLGSLLALEALIKKYNDSCDLWEEYYN